MVNPRDFLLNTDYEMDKIIFANSGSFVTRKEVSHNLGFAPLAFGVWSTDQDFSTVNSIGLLDSNLLPWHTARLHVSCTSYNNKIVIVASGENSGSTTIYYRLFAFEPPNTSHDAPATSDLANTFILNTDYNYRKLKATGVFTQSDQEYVHNLGYLPQVMAWDDFSGFDPDWGIEPYQSSSEFSNSKLIVTPTKIKIGSQIEGIKTYWRVYYDQA